jgi:hypothetical protein
MKEAGDPVKFRGVGRTWQQPSEADAGKCRRKYQYSKALDRLEKPSS